MFTVALFGYALLTSLLLLAGWRRAKLKTLLGAKKQRGRAGYVYGFSDRGQLLPTVKIGRAKDATQRLRSHRTAAPHDIKVWFAIKVPDAVASERAFHKQYLDLRVSKQREWFWVAPMLWFDLLLLKYTFRG